MQQITINERQAEVLCSQAKEIFFVGGLGMGKTFIIAAWIRNRALKYKGCLGLLAAPTFSMLQNATWKHIATALADHHGIYEGEHYVVSKQPPKWWGVPQYSNKNNNVVTFINGSHLLIGNMQDFHKYRGPEFDYIAIDEFREINPAARDVLIPRLRGKKFKGLKVKTQILYATTPPDNPAFLREIRQQSQTNEDIAYITGTTYDNAHNLPAGYIEGLQAILDDRTFRREVMGELIVYTTGLFLYAWNPDEHPRVLEANYNYPAYVAFDFNVTPMTCVVCQHYQGQILVLKEFVQEDTDIWRFCALIKPYLAKFPAVFVTGDASGRNRSGISRENANYYSVILDQLRLSERNIHVPVVNPTHLNSRVLCNSLFEKHPRLYVDYRCKTLIADIEMVQVNEKGEIVKSDPKLTHLLDCLRYYLHTYHYEWLDKYVERNRLEN